jgi:glyoxylate/hydroxypyruvate reductase A
MNAAAGETILLAVGGDDPGQWLPVFAEHYPGERVLWHGNGALDDATLASVAWAVVWAPKQALYARIPNVRAIFSLGAGVDHILGPGITPPDVPIVRYVGTDLTSRMSEWVVQHCLMHLRQHRAYEAQKREHIWRSLDQPSAGDVRVGIMGLGVLGQDAARKLAMLGFPVSGWSRTAKAIDGVETFAGAAGFDAFLAQTDMLVSLLPHTPETERLVTRAVLSKLARNGALGGPVYLNAGRGKTQKDADIAAALADGTLLAASLDVFEIEPLPANSPLWSAPNLFITPHAAAWSKRSDVVHYVMRQIDRARTGLPFEHVVDRARGY